MLAPTRRLIGRGRRKRKNGWRFLSAAVSNRPGKLQRAHVSPLWTFLQVDSWVYYILLFSPCTPQLPRVPRTANIPAVIEMHIYMRSNAVDARLKHTRADEKRHDPRRKRNDEGDGEMEGAKAQERQEDGGMERGREERNVAAQILSDVRQGVGDGITPISDTHMYALMKGGRGGPAGKVARRIAAVERWKTSGMHFRRDGDTWKGGGQTMRHTTRCLSGERNTFPLAGSTFHADLGKPG